MQRVPLLVVPEPAARLFGGGPGKQEKERPRWCSWSLSFAKAEPPSDYAHKLHRQTGHQLD